MVFQYLYFTHYYYIREWRKGGLNLKYGPGGTRDFLIPIQLSNLRDSVNYIQNKKESSILKAIESLFLHKNINLEKKKEFEKSVNIIAFFKNELLRVNKREKEGWNTFVNKKSIKYIFKKNKKLFSSEEEIKNLIEYHMNNVFLLKELSWIVLLQYFKEKKDRKWYGLLNKIILKKLNEKIIKNFDYKDEILSMFLIWNYNISEKRFKNFLNKIIKKKSWVILTSIVSHPNCPPDILDKIVDRHGTKKGFEYILKVTAQKGNIWRSTLRKIAKNKKIEWRFKEHAVMKLKLGIGGVD